jgi:NAD-dependent SIR2 family protein deacetylase
MSTSSAASAAAQALRSARALIITAGAGMGVDSGLPDFRGDQGFWKAYPPYELLGVSFVDAANPRGFEHDPAFGWGFYGHRLGLYRETVPHAGFGILLRWIRELRLDHWVVTSNVDGQFQKAGFPPDRVKEIHGSIHHLQCTGPCTGEIWPNTAEVPVDLETMRAEQVPVCLRCGAVARPNILMFGDGAWVPARTNGQGRAFDRWTASLGDARVVVVEMGAGTAIPSIRFATEHLGARPGAVAIRINPREPEVRQPHLSLPVGALEGLQAIDAELHAGATP